jgi:hypothetical protein
MAVNEQVIETLRGILDKTKPSSEDESCKVGAQIKDAKSEVIRKYQPIFSPDNLNELTATSFKSFLLFTNNQHWDGLHRQSGWMTQDMSKLKQALRLLLDENLPIKTRLNKLRPDSGQVMVKGFGRAVITAILQVMFPDKYGVLNNIAEKAMKKLGLWPEFSTKAAFGEKYEVVNRILLEVSEELRIDLWTLDMLWWRVEKMDTSVSKDSMQDETEVESAEVEETSESVFGLEKFLHEFLVDNWDVTELSKNWSLLDEDGEIIGSHYRAGEIGEIDLLAKHNTDKKFLVIELKAGRTSNSTIGQILRYMSWVRKNLAINGETVEGCIICRSLDRKLQYALDGLSNIRCMTYDVKFSLNVVSNSAINGLKE